MSETYPHTPKIRDFLKSKSDLVKQNGLNYLIPTWRRFAENYADKEELIYEWLNDLDSRRIIDEILKLLSNQERIKVKIDLTPIDKLVIEKTFQVSECVLGEEIESAQKYNRVDNWYYYILNEHLFKSESGKFTRRN